MNLSSSKMIGNVEGHIGWMIFNNPEKRNAISHEMRVAALEILEHFANNDQVRVVMMKGAGGKAFVSGADISQFDPGEKGEAQRRHEAETSLALRRAHTQFSKPVVAVIEGYCLGGGVLAAMMADIRIASDDAIFGIPAARLGIGYPADGVRRLVDLVGPAKAKEILFTGGRFDAGEALRIGLINTMVPRLELENRARDFAAVISDNAPLSIRAAKVTVDQILLDESQRDDAAVSEAIARCANSADFAEGRKAFAQKRRPAFTGN